MDAHRRRSLTRGRRSTRKLVGTTVLAMLAALLTWVAATPPAVADEGPPPSSYVECGYGFVCDGTAPVTGWISPITVSSGPGSEPWNKVVQPKVDPNPEVVTPNPLASLEAEATAMVAALHAVPNDQRLVWWARAEIRAMMYARLVMAIEKPASHLTADELQWLWAMSAFVKARRVTMAENALAEWRRWFSDPCTYTPPFSYLPPPKRPICELGNGGQLTTIAGSSWDFPPSFEQFEAYGSALQSDADFGTLDAQKAVTDATKSLAFFGGAAAAGVLSLIASVTAGTVAAGAMGGLTASLTWASGISAMVTAGAVAGAVAMAVFGVVGIAIQAWQIGEAKQLEWKVKGAVDKAKSQHVDLYQLLHMDCDDLPDGCGHVELFTTLLAQTLPDYAAERTARQQEPARRASDPFFKLYDQSGNFLGNATNISPQGADNLSMSDGWFITNSFTNQAEWALESEYEDWEGNQGVVALHGEKFTTRPALGHNGQTPVVSPPKDCFNLLIQGQKRTACWAGNHAPQVAPTVSANPVEGAPVTLRANATDVDGDALTYRWLVEPPEDRFDTCIQPGWWSCDWSPASTADVTVTYPNDGIQRATVIVTDSTGLSSAQSLAFRVANVDPVVVLDPASPTAIAAGETVTLTGTVTDQGNDDNALTVDWGDGTTSHYVENTCNLPPTQICFDPGDWGSPPLGTREFEFTHTYTQDPQGALNTLHPKVTASDNAGSSSATTPVQILPGAFRVVLASIENGLLFPGDRRTSAEGDDQHPVQVSAYVTWPGPIDVEVNWGDGEGNVQSASYPCGLDDCLFINKTPAPGLSQHVACNGECPGLFLHFTHHYADGPSTPVVSVKVSDRNGHVITVNPTANILNVDPDPSFTDGGGATGTAREGEPYPIQVEFTDPGDDTFVSTVDWGDGTVSNCDQKACLWPWIKEEHTYYDTGQFDVTVTVTDDDGGVGQVVRTVDVEPQGNLAPVAYNTSTTTDEDTSVTVAPPVDDEDEAALTYEAGDPEHGSVEVTDEGLVYTPDADYSGQDSFTYTVSDGELTSEPAIVTITVNPVNDAPYGSDTLVETVEDVYVLVDPSGTDADGETVTFELLTVPDHGTLQGTSAPWTYVPDADYHGPDEFDYFLKSGPDLVVKTARITVRPVNDRPTAQDATEETTEDVPLTFRPDMGDIDGDDPMPVIVDQPTHGTASVTASGELRYVPAPDYSGPDSFTYRASDGKLVSEVATVSITVLDVNDPPTIEPVDPASATYSDPIAPIVVTASDKETPTQLSYGATGLPGGLTIASTGTIAGKPTGAPGSYDVTVKVCDGDGECATTSFVIDVLPEAAVVRLAPNNPHAVATDNKGKSPAMTFTGRITDSNDGSFGDIGRIVASDLSLRLVPVGGGGTVTCAPSITKRVAATATAPGFVDISCSVAAGTKVDVYDVLLDVSGHFTGSDASLLSVYDPKERGANGAGTIPLANGNTGEFAFTAAASGKNAKGKVAFLERTPDGEVVTTVKGTAFQTLVVGTGSPLPAALTGKAVVNGIGNYTYVINVADGGTTADTFAMRLTAPAGAPSFPYLSFTALPVRAGGAVSVK